ncbi:MAG: outer membrane beta-barrel protein [Fulvivirga sp.]
MAQSDFRPGYVITNEGDSINGSINYRVGSANYEECQFQMNSTVKTYAPVDLKKYGFVNDKTYISKYLPDEGTSNQKVFLEILSQGAINLYKYNATYYVEKNESEFYQLTNKVKKTNVDGNTYYQSNNAYKGVLSYLLAECYDLKNKIKKVTLNELKLTRLVNDYNKCQGNFTITPKQNKQLMAFEGGLKFGFQTSSISFEPSFLEDFSYLFEKWNISKSIIAGASVELSFPRLYERVSFYSEVLYTSSKYISHNQITATYGIDRNDVEIELSTLQVPLGFRYTFPEKLVAPYFNVGFLKVYNFNESIYWVKEEEVQNVIRRYESDDFLSVSSSQTGYWIGLGVKKTISSKLKGSFEIRYQYTNGISEDLPIEPYSKSEITNLQLLLGIQF